MPKRPHMRPLTLTFKHTEYHRPTVHAVTVQLSPGISLNRCTYIQITGCAAFHKSVAEIPYVKGLSQRRKTFPESRLFTSQSTGMGGFATSRCKCRSSQLGRSTTELHRREGRRKALFNILTFCFVSQSAPSLYADV